MSREKQIEEMAKAMCGNGMLNGKCALDSEPCNLECVYGCCAEKLYAKGYRKQSEVAREIFEEIEKVIGEQYENYVFDNLEIEGVEQDAIIAFADSMKRHFAELKNKYTEEIN